MMTSSIVCDLYVILKVATIIFILFPEFAYFAVLHWLNNWLLVETKERGVG